MDKALFLLSLSMERGVENLEPRGGVGSDNKRVSCDDTETFRSIFFFNLNLHLTVENDILPSPEPI